VVLLVAFPESKGLSMFFAASGVLLGLWALWSGRHLQMEVDPAGLRKTALAVVLNGLLVAVILWLATHPAGH
jgi:hypothetical protein